MAGPNVDRFTYKYDLLFNPGTGDYTLGAQDVDYWWMGDDENDTDVYFGTAGDGVENAGDAVALERDIDGADFPGYSYTGWQTSAGVILEGPFSSYILLTNWSGEPPAGTATYAGPYFYPVCFLPGTLITTPAGERAIETLQIGDLVTTASGAQKPVKWIGRMTIPLTRFNRETAAPICIRQGALGNGLPQRDLYVSSDHAIAIDGLLVTAGLLVNGGSIVRCADFSASVVDYLHVELDEHDLLLAEGLATESLHDTGGTRAKFDNAAEFHALYPHFVPGLPMALGRVSSMRQLPKALRAKLLGGLAA